MKTPSKILAAVDRSPLALRVVKNAIDLANATDSELHFLFVKVPYAGPYDKLVDVHRHLFIREQLEEQHAESVIVTQSSVDADEVAPGIVEFARANDCDFIVMGSHGRRGFRKLMLGSVALEVMRSASCPVFTIGGKDETEAGHNPMAQILIPFDFSDYSLTALEYAARLAEKLHANLDVLHVVEDTFYPAFYGPFMHSIYESTPNIEKLVEEQMRRHVEDTGFDMRRVVLSVRPGHPGSEIAHYADEKAIDIIIMATHGLSGLQHLFMGSVTERTAHLAKCPVLTLRPDKASTEPRDDVEDVDSENGGVQ